MASTYTFTPKPALQESSGQLSYFAGQINDGNRIAIQSVGAGPQTVDISGTPVTSPIAFPSASVTTLTTPLNAAFLTLTPLANSINVSESDPNVAGNYFTVAAGQSVTIGVTRTAKLYIKANTGAATGSTFFYAVI